MDDAVSPADRVDAVIRAQEEERRRIAREIHDGPAQALASLSMRIEICEKLLTCDPERAAAELADVKKGLASCLNELRRVISNLRPMVLDDLGLVPALKREAERFGNDTGLPCDVTVMGREVRMPQAIETAVFRTAQEALANVRKHARASTVYVRVVFLAGSINLVVKDDGRGFDAGAVPGVAGGREAFGLAGMKERAALLGGKLEVDSRPGRGTRVALHLPIPSADEPPGAGTRPGVEPGS